MYLGLGNENSLHYSVFILVTAVRTGLCSAFSEQCCGIAMLDVNKCMDVVGKLSAFKLPVLVCFKDNGDFYYINTDCLNCGFASKTVLFQFISLPNI
jgi:hypothetical protein